jgi:hypothetical protein
MNLQRLRTAEMEFLQRYPGGFGNEEMVAIGKKHRVDQLAEQAQVLLAKDKFRQQGQVMDDIIKVISRSSMVSMFEKPKFRDYVNGLSRDDRAFFAAGFKELLHFKNQEKGFNKVLDVLSEGKLARWSLMTCCLMYMRPNSEVFVKPTTTKNIISFLELELEYKPRPSWAFYEQYRDIINSIKTKVDPSLGPNNAALTGFLMVTLQK